MRSVMQMISGGTLAVVGLLVAGLLVSMIPIRPQLWLYPLVRQAVATRTPAGVAPC